MLNTKIAFLGAGNMAEAIIAGIAGSKLVPPQRITASDVRKERLNYLKKKFGIKAADGNRSAVKASKIIFLCVKPQSMEELLSEIGPFIRPSQLVVSIAAGITTRFIEGYLTKNVPVVRAMPNLPLLAGEGVAGICRGRAAKKAHAGIVKKIFSASGLVVEIPEKKINAVTALSGSGPAYVFYLAEMLKTAGTEMGLAEDIADRLARQTVFGAGKMLKEQELSASQMRKNVTSPGGTTEAAVKHLEMKKFSKIFVEAVKLARKRAGELSK
jgi:pyrroline-5-carboxylate reductase